MNEAKPKTRVRLDNESKFVVVGPKEEDSKKKSSSSALFQATEIGFSVTLPMLGGVFFGSWLDAKNHSQPKMTLVFLVIGIVVGFVNLWSVVTKFTKKHRKP